VVGGIVGRLSELSKSSGLFRACLCASVEVIGELCFSGSNSLKAISFGPDSKLSRIEGWAFQGCGLASIDLHASVGVFCESCFYHYKSLKAISFEPGSKLSRIEQEAFFSNG
jgi:hypothetical protein